VKTVGQPTTAEMPRPSVRTESRQGEVSRKGAKERELPVGQTATQVLRRYQRGLTDLRPGDPFFISRYGGRITRKSVHELVARYGEKAGVWKGSVAPLIRSATPAPSGSSWQVATCSPLQKLLGHTTLSWSVGT
jgi:site-specific recombinase XerD